MIWSMIYKTGWGFLVFWIIFFLSVGIGFLLCWAVNQEELEKFQEWLRK